MIFSWLSHNMFSNLLSVSNSHLTCLSRWNNFSTLLQDWGDFLQQFRHSYFSSHHFQRYSISTNKEHGWNRHQLV